MPLRSSEAQVRLQTSWVRSSCGSEQAKRPAGRTSAWKPSARTAVTSGCKPKLVTTGVYRYSRHPAYLAYLAMATGVFLVIPNVITLTLLAYTGIVTYGHALEEERKLAEMYGEEYERYRSEVGRFFPRPW